MNRSAIVATLRADLAEIDRAADGAALRALYLDRIGLGALDVDTDGAEDPTPPDQVREILRDFVREDCAALGVHWSEVAPPAPQ